MKKTLRLVGVAAMVLLLAASCKKEEKNNGEKQMMTFSAGIEQGNSKTYLTPDGPHAYKQFWTEGDRISVNGSPIDLDAGCGGKDVGTFSGKAEKADHYYAVYPESAWRDDNKAVFTIPEIQNYNKDNGYPLNVNGPMYASSDDQTLQFHNLCGLMQLNLKSGVGKPLTVTKLEVVSYLVNQVGLYGTSDPVDLTSDEPTLTIANANNKSVTLNCGEGVEIGTEQATPFVIALPPYKFGYNATKGEGGLFVNVYVKGTEGIYASIQYKKEIIVNAGEVAYTEATICPQIFLATTAIDEAQDVTATTATVGGSVMSLEHGLNVVEKGIVYQLSTAGTVLDPAIACYIPATTTEGNNFSAELTGLESGKTYYCWAYAKCKYRDAVDYDFIQYGGFISFTTKNSSAPDGFVDFGTHVGGVPTGNPLYWAKCNVGATNPQDYGNFYAWGFTTATTNGFYWGSDGYYWGYEGGQGFRIYRYCHNSSNWEYKAEYSFGTTMDGKAVLIDSDDVAYTTSNGLNRMPTKEEYDELKQKAFFVWTSNYKNTGVAGCVVYVSKDPNDSGFTHGSAQTYSVNNDEHIFLPAGGRMIKGNNYDGRGTWTRIWTKSLYSVPGDNDPRYAMVLGMENNKFSHGDSYGNFYQGRNVSLNIRPVREGN